MPEPFKFIPHPHIAARLRAGPPKVADVTKMDAGAPWYDRFNAALAVKITEGVGTMWCAYAFAALALKWRLHFRPDTIVVSVPYQVE